MNKHPKQNAKPPTPAAHPETQPQRPKTGAPGSESSKLPSSGKDARNAHDKDGNGEQRRS